MRISSEHLVQANIEFETQYPYVCVTYRNYAYTLHECNIHKYYRPSEDIIYIVINTVNKCGKHVRFQQGDMNFGDGF